MKNTRRKGLVPILILLLSPMTAFAAGLGTSGAPFLSLRTNARSEALAGALTAGGDDLSALQTNPATLSRLRYSEALFSQTFYFQETKYSYFAFARPFQWGTPSIDFLYLGYGSINDVDRNGVLNGAVSPKDSFLSFSWASNGKQIPIENLDLGLSLKYLQSDLGPKSVNSFAANLGAQYRSPWEGVEFGAAVNHLGGGMKFANESDPLPRTIRLGVSYLTQEFRNFSSKVRFSFDGVVPRDGSAYLSAGAELFALRIFSVELGYAGEEAMISRVRYGFGIGIDALQIQYAAAPFGDFGTTHRISLRSRFGQNLWGLKDQLSSRRFNEVDLAQAQKYLDQGNLDRAAFFASKVARKNPENEAANAILGKIQQAQKAEAASVIYSDAMYRLRIGKNSDAMELLKQCLELDPQNVNYQTTLETIQSANQKQQAKLELEKIKAPLYALEAEFEKFRGQGLSQEAETDQTVAAAKAAYLQEKPSEASSYITKGWSQINALKAVLQARELEKAKEREMAMLPKTPQTPAAPPAAASALIPTPTKETPQTAPQPELKKSAEEAPMPVQNQEKKSNGENGHNGTKKEKKITPDLAPEPVIDEAMKNDYEKGLNAMQSRAFDEAIKILESVYNRNKKFQDVRGKLVFCYQSKVVTTFSNGETDDAIKFCNKGLKIDPRNATLQTFLKSCSSMSRD